MKQDEIGKKLSKLIKCAVLWNNDIRNFYSVDASSYRLKPSVIAFPENKAEVIKIIKFASRYRIPVTPRGAGTGLVGSALGRGVVLDMRYFDKIKTGTNYVKVESGVSKGHLDEVLKKHGRFLGPDPSIGPFCTIGGMIATNASGSHSLKYGSMVDSLLEIEIVNSSGKLVTLPSFNKISKRISRIIPSNIKEFFPKVSKNSCGYRLDKIYSEKDLQKIFAGSEGTLGIILSSKLKTYPLPAKSLLAIVSYKTLMDAVKDVPTIIRLNPSAIELIDSNITKHMKIKLSSNVGCLLFIEFDTDIEKNMVVITSTVSGKVVRSITDKKEIKKFWSFRNSALSYSLRSISKDETAPTLIEDATVPVRRLPLLLRLLDVISKKYDLRLIVYGHAGNGNLHIRPILKKKDRRLIQKIALEFFSGVIGIGGCITGEHGDGLARTEFVRMQYGDKIYHLFDSIKSQFDPKGILNPGKIIVQGSTVTKNLKV